MPEEAKAKWKRSKRDIVLVLNVALVLGHLVGRVFYHAYLVSYGVDPDSFPLQIQDTYVMAYYAVFCFLFVVIKPIAEIVIFLFCDHLVWILLELILLVGFFYCRLQRQAEDTKKQNKLKKISKDVFEYLHWDNKLLTRSVIMTGKVLYRLTTILLFVAVFPACLIVPLFTSYHAGKKTAEKEMEVFREHGCERKNEDIWINCKSLVSKDKQVLREGVLVAHNKDYIAFLTKDGSFVSKMPDGSFVKNKFAE